jgi:hypothetical protein
MRWRQRQRGCGRERELRVALGDDAKVYARAAEADGEPGDQPLGQLGHFRPSHRRRLGGVVGAERDRDNGNSDEGMKTTHQKTKERALIIRGTDISPVVFLLEHAHERDAHATNSKVSELIIPHQRGRCMGGRWMGERGITKARLSEPQAQASG